jgi:hypothetical protein
MKPEPGTWAQISKAAALDTRLSAAAFRVLAVLSAYSNDAGYCYPSIATIATRLGLKERVVQYHLRTLEKFGYLVTVRQSRPRGFVGRRANGARMGGGWAPNAYELHFPTPPSLAADGQGATALHLVTSDKVQSDDMDKVQSHCM